MANELASANDSTGYEVESRDESTASRLFDEMRDLILSSKKAASLTKTDAAEAENTRSESGAQDAPEDKDESSDNSAATAKSAAAPAGLGQTRATAGMGGGGHASGFGRRHGTPSTLVDDVADNVKEHPIATGIEAMLFPPLVILDTEIRKLVDKPVSRTGR